MVASKKVRRKKGSSRRGKARIKPVVIPNWGIALLVCALLVILAAPLLHRKDPDRGARVPPGLHHYAVDLSHHNEGPVQWDSLMVLTDAKGHTIRSVLQARDLRPVPFVILKATEGETLQDSRFQERWIEAGQHGIRRGAYHFYRSSKSPDRQAAQFIRTLGPIRYTDLPPILDVETLHRGGSDRQLNADLLVFLQTLERHYGRKPILYTYASFAKDHLSEAILSKYPLWIARYNRDAGPDRGDWLLWQFTDKAVVHGIPGRVDLSIVQPSLLNP